MAPLVDSMLSRDAAATEELALQALEQGASRADVIADYFQPALAAVNELWYQGSISASTELQVAEIFAAAIDQLPPTPTADPVDPGSRYLLTTLEGEQHLNGIKVLSMVLADDGWNVEVVPPGSFHELDDIAEATAPQLVGISCGYLEERQRLSHTVAALSERGCRVMLGGVAVDRATGLWSRVGAHAYAMDARVAVVIARRLLADWQRRQEVRERFRYLHERLDGFSQQVATARSRG